MSVSAIASDHYESQRLGDKTHPKDIHRFGVWPPHISSSLFTYHATQVQPLCSITGDVYGCSHMEISKPRCTAKRYVQTAQDI